MAVHNTEVADLFDKMADLLEIKDENPFRIRAYRNAALTIRNLSKSLKNMIEEDIDLTGLPHIGKDLAAKIREIVETGTFAALKKVGLPLGLSELMRIGSLGGRGIKKLYEGLHITNLEELKEAAETGKIREIVGFAEHTEKKILENIATVTESKKRTKLIVADRILEDFVEYLKSGEVAGSVRRRKETVGDGDILVADDGSDVIDRFVVYEDVKKVLAKGPTKSSVLLKSGFQVDLRVIGKESYGAALLYFTGSKEHNIELRKMAVKKGLKINEYGLFDGKKRIAGKSEQEMYRALGLPYIEPELREDRGEIDAAQKGKLPSLIDVKDIRGDLHMHSTYSDGKCDLEGMVQAAVKKGYEYIGVTEHSQRIRIAGGLKPKEVEKVIRHIDRLNKKFKNIIILKGIEVDILEDGKLDLPDDILAQLDYRVCSVHYKFNLSLQAQTERIIRAMDSPYFNILGHPTGRIIGGRKPYDIDMERIMQAAKERGCVLEVNSQPDRLDLNDLHCRMAKEIGVKVAVSTDAHSIDDLDRMKYGVGQARRGWIEKKNVINTGTLRQLKKAFKRR